MSGLFLSLLSAVIAVLLFQVNGLLATLFLVVAFVSVPAVVIHRREMAHAPEGGPDAEGAGAGFVRVVRHMGIDTTGIALGVLLVILIALIARMFAQ